MFHKSLHLTLFDPEAKYTYERIANNYKFGKGYSMMMMIVVASVGGSVNIISGGTNS